LVIRGRGQNFKAKAQGHSVLVKRPMDTRPRPKLWPVGQGRGRGQKCGLQASLTSTNSTKYARHATKNDTNYSVHKFSEYIAQADHDC